MKVAVFDAYPYLYSGEFVSDWSIQGLPLGGFRHLMDKVLYESLRGYSCIVVFDPRVKIQTPNREYKAGRQPNMAIWAQAQMAEEYLERIGIATICEKGYEADDVICAIADEMENQSDDYIETVIYTSDLDLAHCVSPSVRLMPATSAGKSINVSNFSIICSTASQIVYYNTISAYKVFNGCHSDNIKGMKNGYELYERYKQYLTNDLGLLESHELREVYYIYKFAAEVLVPEFGFDNDSISEFIKRVDLVYPREFKNPYNVTFKEIAKNSTVKDVKPAGEVAKMDRCKSVMTALHVTGNELSKETLDDIKRRAVLLSSGTYAVSADIPPEVSILENFGRRF